jgi:hypothetical protein
MPIYLCSGSVCRVRNRRSFLSSKVTGVQSITDAEHIVARSEAEARDKFWNEYFHPRLIELHLPVEGLRIKVREISPEVLQNILMEALLLSS